MAGGCVLGILGAVIGAIAGGVIGGNAAWAIGAAVFGALMALGTAVRENEETQHKKEVENLLRDIKDNKKGQ